MIFDLEGWGDQNLVRKLFVARKDKSVHRHRSGSFQQSHLESHRKHEPVEFKIIKELSETFAPLTDILIYWGL